MPDASTWDVVAALGSAAGAIAAAIAAGAAWRAASAAQTTSREAREAVSLAIVPNVTAELIEMPREPDDPSSALMRLEARVINRSQWTASKIELAINYEDGETFDAKRERLVSFGSGEDDDWWIALRGVTAGWPPPATSEALDVVVRYSDERDLGRYERTYRARLTRDNAAVIVDMGNMNERSLR